MKKGHTKIACIIDESGSMGSIRNDAIGGMNTFIEEQKKLPGYADVTIVYFNDRHHTIIEDQPIETVKPLTDATYTPSGSTALLDAIGNTVDTIGKKLAALDESERPEKVLVCILTDGEENCSREYTNEKIKEKIEHQRSNYGWEFIFLAANQDAFQAAANYGISKGFTQSFQSNRVGTRAAYAGMSVMAASYRSQP